MDSVGCRVMDQKIAGISQENQVQQRLQKQQNQEPLNCPRCDSTNTKFCYYNNYSLSQPRHFCKACKRYWTKGGTLRNVPVGGGCRRNKRVKRPSTSSSSSSFTNSNLDVSSPNSASCGGQIHDLMSSASTHGNPLFYGLSTNHNLISHINPSFLRYDLQNPPHINGLGLGFSPSSCGFVYNMNGDVGEFRNGLGHFSFPASNKQTLQDLVSSNPLLSNYSTNTAITNNASSPTISSLLASSLQIKGLNNFQTRLPSYENEPHMKGVGSGGMFMKEVKIEGQKENKPMDHHANSQNEIDQTMSTSSLSDPSFLWGVGANNLGAWLDPSNSIGSSIPSFI